MQEIDKSYRENLHVVVEDHIPQGVIDENNKKKSWAYGYNPEYDMVVISKDGTIGEIISIETLKIALPAPPKGKIRFEGLANTEQKWQRYPVPDDLVHFDKFYGNEKNVESKINEIWLKHKKFIDDDFEKIDVGCFFYNDGEICYIPGSYYFFLEHYLLPEDGVFPNFRMPQRDYFIYKEACDADSRCVGDLLLKSRRSAYTVGSTSDLLRDALRYKNSYFPIMADVEKHAKKIFQNYIIKPLVAYPKHLQPMRSGNTNPLSDVRFEAIKKKLTTNSRVSTEADGLNTHIDVVATTLNAYDSTRPRRSLNDEIGKTEMDIVDWWAVHKKCHLQGKVLKGKARCGSTANPPQKGGRSYQILYNNSKLSTRLRSGFTKSGLYKIFIKADLAQSGFFDEWGYAIVHNPIQPIKNELGEWTSQGTKEFLDEKEAACNNLKELNYEKRQDPRNDSDPFLDEDDTNMYAQEGMMNLIKFLQDYQIDKKYKSTVFRCNFEWKDGNIDGGEVVMNHSETGRFMIYAPDGIIPIPKEFRNSHIMKDGKLSPRNTHLASLGIDPFTANRTQYGGSKEGIVGMTTDHFELSETQQELTWIYYNFRGTTYEEAVEDAIMCCVYFSIPALIERNKDSIVKDFKRRGYRNFVANDPFKKPKELNQDDKYYGGVVSRSNLDKQEAKLHSYVSAFPKEFNENQIKCPFLDLNTHASEYTRENRGSKDDVVAWMLARAATTKPTKQKEDDKSKTQTNSYTSLKEMFYNPDYEPELN